MNRRAASLWLPVAAYMTAIFVISSLPSIPEPPGMGGIDKPEHYIVYAGLAVLVVRAVRGSRAGWRLTAVALATVAIAAAYGATDEFHQLFVRTRRCEFLDWVSDLLGAGTGTAAATAALVTKARRRGMPDGEREREGI